MYKSEAEAYQDIRREWKRKRNNAQREQTLLMWQLSTGETHPYIRRVVATVRKCALKDVRMPLDKEAKQHAFAKQAEASMYQQLLNNYKVKHDASKTS